MDINQYLQRFRVEDVKEISLETLNQLQLQHMLHVPFENLDVIHRIPITLNLEAFYNKIVLNNRGGFCYELNGLFNWLLQSLGFNSYLISGTINRPDGSWALKGSHASLIVEIDQPYLVDVGFGDSVRGPLPLTGETKEDVSGIYRVVKVEDTFYDLQRKNNQDWDTLYRLDIRPRELKEFKNACYFNQTSPKSHFTQKQIVSLAAKDGRFTLSGNSFIVTRLQEKQKRNVDIEEIPYILKKYFHIKNI